MWPQSQMVEKEQDDILFYLLEWNGAKTQRVDQFKGCRNHRIQNIGSIHCLEKSKPTFL